MQPTEQNVRSLPGFSDWALILGTTALGAAEFQVQTAQSRTQSATAYYFETPFIPTFHLAALILDVLVFIVPVLWILTNSRRACRVALSTAALIGFALCWTEAVYASSLETGIFTLPSLPFSPVNNVGLIGAQVFGTYLILSLPASRGSKIAFALVRAALAVCLWLAQMAVWTVFR